jgi:nitroreductase
MHAMDALDAVFARRDVRTYADRPISSEDLDRVLEAGRRAPSSINMQRWDFVVVTDRVRLRELAKVWERGGRHVATSAATIALLGPDSADPDEQVDIAFDLGQAAQNIQIAAAGLGIGSGHSSVIDQDLCRQLLGYPTDRRCDYLITLGYPADRPIRPLRAHKRRPFDDVVHREGW